jgi:hypothetical protein
MLSPQALQEFKEIWKKEKGYELPDDLALPEAIALLTFTNVTFHPLKKEWVDKNYEKHREHTE